MQTLKLTEHVRRRIAVAANADPRSVKKFCEGKPLKPMTAERIEQAMRAEGLLPVQQGKAP